MDQREARETRNSGIMQEPRGSDSNGNGREMDTERDLWDLQLIGFER